MAKAPVDTTRMIQVGFLAWLLPGLGHWRLGHRGLALLFCLAISVPYFVGLAVGGLKTSINPWANPWLFLAEMAAGGYTTAGLLINRAVGEPDPRLLADPKYLASLPDETAQRYAAYVSFIPESDVAQIYLATAGLLNIMAILDALTRARTGGLPTFYHELAPAPRATEEPTP